MQMDMPAQLAQIIPELLLAAGAVVSLLFGLFSGRRAYGAVTALAAAFILMALCALLLSPLRCAAFGGALVLDGFGRYMKILALACAAIVLIMALSPARAGKFDKFEFPVLVLLACLGMLLMISAANMLSLYLGLELHSLALYVMAALQRDNARSAEAGLKYFVLGALASGLLLYGVSLLYGFSGGHLDYPGIARALGGGAPPLGLVCGLVFVLAGAAFKISAVPFHMWTPDVYQGAPAPVAAFFATASKIAAVAMVTRLTHSAFSSPAAPADIMPAWRQIIIFIAVASMFLGAFAGLGQSNIKRLMAYSSIAHIGYILAGLAAGTAAGIAAALLYLTLYAVIMLGCFAFIPAMNTPEGYSERLEDLAGLARANPFMAGVMTALMFALAGIPPLSGFFGKWYLFSAAVGAHLTPLAVAGVISAVIAAAYYLRVVKIMWFDEPKGAGFLPIPRELRLIMLASALFTALYPLFGACFVPWAQAAAQSLF